MYLCGIKINCYRSEDILNTTEMPKLVVTVNAEAIVRSQSDRKLREIINNNYATIDGQIPLWLYKLAHGKNSRIEKISGSELIYTLPQYASQNNKKVFLLGGKEESNNQAINKLREKYEGLKIEGYSPPYHPYPFPDETNDFILEKISKFKPDILFVGFGMGKQEYWEDDNYKILKEIGVKLIIGCGGSFDFASGKIKRAPKFIQNCGFEGIWRLLNEFKWFRIKRLLLSSKIFNLYLNYHILKTKQ